MEPRIGEYSAPPPVFQAHDRGATVAAQRLMDSITAQDSRLRVEHVGSTAVPGCGGKGTIDLAVIYPDRLLAVAKTVLDALGFQRQQSRDPFPEDRPMRVGSLEYAGVSYPVHAHVLAATSPEIDDLLRFRDRLRSDVSLQRAYEAEKVRILAGGVLDAIDYAEKKGDFVRRILGGRRTPAPEAES